MGRFGFTDSFRKFMEKRLLLQYIMRAFLRVMLGMIVGTSVLSVYSSFSGGIRSLKEDLT